MIIEVKVFILIILVNFDKVDKFSLDLIFPLGLLEILTPKFISVIGLQRIHGESFFLLEMTEVHIIRQIGSIRWYNRFAVKSFEINLLVELMLLKLFCGPRASDSILYPS